MSYLRTSKRRREREQRRAAGRESVQQAIDDDSIGALLSGTPLIPWESVGLTRSEACAELGMDPEGGDEQFAIVG